MTGIKINERALLLMLIVFLAVPYLSAQKELPNVKSMKFFDNTENLPFALEEEDYFGSAITNLGDIDGNGSDDLAIGAYGDDDARANVGCVYIVLMDGADVLSYTKIQALSQVSANAEFGMAVANIGDIDGNGTIDIAVGAPSDLEQGSSTVELGSVSIYFLDSSANTIGSTYITQDSSGFAPATSEFSNSDGFGSAIASIGDIDGDGINDIAVGVKNRTHLSQATIGGVWVLKMNNNGTVKGHNLIASNTGLPYDQVEYPSTSELGSAIASIGDIDDDGVEDIIIGAPGHDGGPASVTNSTNSGAVWVVMLNADGTAKNYQRTSMPLYGRTRVITDNDRFGGALTYLGDINNDGYKDVAVGARDRYNNGSSVVNTGAFYICSFNNSGELVLLRKYGDGTANFQETLGTNDMYSWLGLSSISDIDGDGIDEVVSGLYLQDDGKGGFAITNLEYLNESNIGTVRSFNEITEYSGGADGTSDYSIANSDLMGYSVSPIGDFNGDGFQDIMVGRIGNDAGGSARGRVDIIFLNQEGERLGSTYINNTVMPGYLGNVDYFGSALDTLGDLDGNGVMDIIVGAQNDDDGYSNAGAAYILYLNNTNSVVGIDSVKKISDLTSNFSGYLGSADLFGRSVANIGDVDGDGVTDIAIGAMQDDPGTTNAGAIYIIFLNDNGTIKSTQKISRIDGGLGTLYGGYGGFGTDITSLGDRDGDGVPDIAVGARMGSSNQGAVFIIDLNSTGTVKSTTIIDATDIPAIQNNSYFGQAVDAIGDVNGDGITDLAIGAMHDDDGDNNAGSVWIVCLDASNAIVEYQKISPIHGRFGYNPQGSDVFGYAIAGLGDVDEDGYFDIVVGMPYDDEGGTNSGGVTFMSLYTKKITSVDENLYAELQRQLDGSYILTDGGKLRFSYQEEYETHDLSYEIYGYGSTPVVTNTNQTKPVNFGLNTITIDLTSNGDCLSDGFYYIEVTNTKKETFYLRFKQVNNICSGGSGQGVGN